MKSREKKTASRSKPLWVGLVVAGLLVAAVGFYLRRQSQQGTSGGSRPLTNQPSLRGTQAADPAKTQAAGLPAPAFQGTTNEILNTLQKTEDFTQLLNYGTELINRGKIREAVAFYQKAVKLNPEDEEGHFNLAFAMSKLGRTNDAVFHYSEALKILPDYAEAHNNLGNLLVNQGKFNEAIQHFSASLKLAPENPSAHNNLGRALARQGQIKEALPHFAEAARLDPTYVEARHNLAISYLSLDRSEEAVREFTQVLRLSPNFQPAIQGLAKAREKLAGSPKLP